MKNLGCTNSWNFDPDEYINHIKYCNIFDGKRLDYPVTRKKLGNCYYEYTCERCKIIWTVDSSD